MRIIAIYYNGEIYGLLWRIVKSFVGLIDVCLPFDFVQFATMCSIYIYTACFHNNLAGPQLSYHNSFRREEILVHPSWSPFNSKIKTNTFYLIFTMKIITGFTSRGISKEMKLYCFWTLIRWLSTFSCL